MLGGVASFAGHGVLRVEQMLYTRVCYPPKCFMFDAEQESDFQIQ